MRSDSNTIPQSSNLIITVDTPLAELILTYPQLILFLEYFDIHPPLQLKTVGQICTERNVSTVLFIAFASVFAGKTPLNTAGFTDDDVKVIINFLKNTHNYYLNEIYPDVEQCMENIKNINDYDEIKIADKFFRDYFSEVREHLDYENNIVFPYILHLFESVDSPESGIQKSEYSVNEYKEHHTNIEEKLDDLMNLLIRYLPYKNDHRERRRLFRLLTDLNNDLIVHAEIEDLILVPLVEKLERQMKRKK